MINTADLPLPKYFKLKQMLADYISENRPHMRPGAEFKLPSEPELIKKYQMSQITVRRALSELEKDGLIYKINGKGTFVKTAEPQPGEKKKTSQCIGFFSYHKSDGKDPWDWSSDFIKHIRRAVHSRKYNLLSLFRESFEGNSLKSFIETKPVDGLIVLAPVGWKYGEILKKNFPCVFLGECPDPQRDFWVNMDHARGGAMAMDYLVKNGHRDIAVIYVEDKLSQTNNLRYHAGVTVLKEHGIRLRNTMVRSAWYAEESGYAAMSQLLADRKADRAGFSAVFITEFRMGMGAIQAIRDSNLHIPDDISVIFCNGSTYYDFIEQRITYVREPLPEWAEALAGNLVAMIQGKKTKNKNILLAPKLSIGNSVKNLLKKGSSTKKLHAGVQN
jgi:DNA-binding LacI/PurR family transcriptional regulator